MNRWSWVSVSRLQGCNRGFASLLGRWWPLSLRPPHHIISSSLPLVFNTLREIVRNTYFPIFGIILDVVLIYTRDSLPCNLRTTLQPPFTPHSSLLTSNFTLYYIGGRSIE